MSPETVLIHNTYRNIPIIPFLLVTIFSFFYIVLLFLNPFWSLSLLAIMFSALTFFATSFFAACSTRTDLLDPFRVYSAVYCISFGIAPLFVSESDWDFGGKLEIQMTIASILVFSSYCVTALGYHLPVFKKPPRKILVDHHQNYPNIFRILGLSLFAVGILSYAILFLRAGGTSGILLSEKSRTQMFVGFGYLLWASLLMQSGGILYITSRWIPGKGKSMLQAWPLWIAFFCFLLLQGRSRAFYSILVIFFSYHYLVRPLQIRKILIYSMLLVFVSIFAGYARNPEVRFLLVSDFGKFLNYFVSDFPAVSQAIIGESFSRLQVVTLIVSKIPSHESYHWGTTYLGIFNPLLRIIGLGQVQFETAGPQIFFLAHPEYSLDFKTGLQPSFIGELLFNYPPYIALFGSLLFGVFLQWTYKVLIVENSSFAKIALYVAILPCFMLVTFSSLGNDAFEYSILLSPIFFSILISLRPKHTRRALSP